MTDKQINDMLSELKSLEELAREYNKRINEIKSWCKEQGSFMTNKYVCVLTPRTQTRLVPLELAAKEVGMEFLKEHHLINTITFDVVQVTDLKEILDE